MEKQVNPTNVLIAVPSSDLIHTDFSMALLNLSLHSLMNGVQIGVVNPRFSLVQIGRCDSVEHALKMGVNWLFFIDSDMTFPADTLIKLLAHDKDVVCCDASTRRLPLHNVVTKLNGESINYKEDNPHLIELKGGSTACMLIKTSILKNMTKPHFHVEWDGDKYLGEDYYFTKKITDCGSKVYCDTKLSRSIGHIGIKTYGVT